MLWNSTYASRVEKNFSNILLSLFPMEIRYLGDCFVKFLTTRVLAKNHKSDDQNPLRILPLIVVSPFLATETTIWCHARHHQQHRVQF